MDSMIQSMEEELFYSLDEERRENDAENGLDGEPVGTAPTEAATPQ